MLKLLTLVLFTIEITVFASRTPSKRYKEPGPAEQLGSEAHEITKRRKSSSQMPDPRQRVETPRAPPKYATNTEERREFVTVNDPVSQGFTRTPPIYRTFERTPTIPYLENTPAPQRPQSARRSTGGKTPVSPMTSLSLQTSLFAIEDHEGLRGKTPRPIRPDDFDPNYQKGFFSAPRPSSSSQFVQPNYNNDQSFLEMTQQRPRQSNLLNYMPPRLPNFSSVDTFSRNPSMTVPSKTAERLLQHDLNPIYADQPSMASLQQTSKGMPPPPPSSRRYSSMTSTAPYSTSTAPNRRSLPSGQNVKTSRTNTYGSDGSRHDIIYSNTAMSPQNSRDMIRSPINQGKPGSYRHQQNIIGKASGYMLPEKINPGMPRDHPDDDRKSPQTYDQAEEQLIASILKTVDKYPNLPPNFINAIKNREPIGRGTNASVYKVSTESSEHAMKCANDDIDVLDLLEHIREIGILRSISHPNIIVIHKNHIYKHNRRPCYVLDMAPYKDLVSLSARMRRYYERHDRFVELLELLAPRLLLEIGEGLEALNEAGYYHGDLKPNNAVVFADRLALIDFGQSRLIDRDEDGSGGDCQLGSPLFFPPECALPDDKINDTIFDDRGDLWALGVLLYLFVTDNYPNEDDDRQTLFRNIRTPRTYRIDGMSNEFNRVLGKLLSQLHQRYQHAAELLSDPYVQRAKQNRATNSRGVWEHVHRGLSINVLIKELSK